MQSNLSCLGVQYVLSYLDSKKDKNDKCSELKT